MSNPININEALSQIEEGNEIVVDYGTPLSDDLHEMFTDQLEE